MFFGMATYEKMPQNGLWGAILKDPSQSSKIPNTPRTISNFEQEFPSPRSYCTISVVSKAIVQCVCVCV